MPGEIVWPYCRALCTQKVTSLLCVTQPCGSAPAFNMRLRSVEIRKKNGRERASVTGPGVNEFAHRTQLLLASVVQFVQ